MYWQGGTPVTTGGGLRPHGVGELLDGAFSLYRRNFLLFAAITAVVQVPFAMLQLLVYELTNVSGRLSDIRSVTTSVQQGNTLSEAQVTQILNDLGALVAFLGAVLIIQFLLVRPLQQAATTSAVSARYLDQPINLDQAYAAALSRWRSLVALVLWLLLLFAAPLTIGTLLAIAAHSPALLVIFVLAATVFIIVVVVRTTVAPQAVVLEKLGGWQGIKRSFQLTERSAWRVFGISLLLTLIQSIAGAVIILPINALFSGSVQSTQDIASQVGQAIIAVFIAPITLVTLTLLYYDLRIRREGFDIEMLARSL